MIIICMIFRLVGQRSCQPLTPSATDNSRTVYLRSFKLGRYIFIRPSSDGTYYGMVMSGSPSDSPSVRHTLCPSVRLSVRPFSTLFSYMLWHIELKFCTWLCFTVLQIKFECRQFPSIFVGVMPLLECRILKIHSFPHFSLTRLDILSWNFAFDFVLMYYRSSLSVVNFRQFL